MQVCCIITSLPLWINQSDYIVGLDWSVYIPIGQVSPAGFTVHTHLTWFDSIHLLRSSSHTDSTRWPEAGWVMSQPDYVT